MLGSRQKTWLKNMLKDSKADFKVIASSVPWDYLSKEGSLDTWAGFKEEREEIFNFIAENKIDGVILLSADRHRSDVYAIKHPNCYDFYEFESSKLTNLHTHRTKKHALFSYNAKQSFGLIEFDTISQEPVLTFKIVNIDGEIVYTLKVSLNQLKCDLIKKDI